MRNPRSARGDGFIVVTSDDAKLYNSNRMASSAHEALQRGKACLGCRRRKMKCDGMRPICTQCTARNRTDDCEYTDTTSGPTRTQILEETLARLQARVKELENPTSSKRRAQTLPLRDPYPMGTPSVAKSASAGTLDTSDIDIKPVVQDNPVASDPEESPVDNVIRSGSESSEGTQESSAWWELEEPPPDMANMLVRIFLPNSQQLGFALNITRFLNFLATERSHPTYPHHGLMNAIYLWALRLSKEPSLQKHEINYLQRAISILQTEIGGGMGNPSDDAFPIRVLHVMQAEVLIAQYLFTHGRILEGRYHANAAVSVAVSYGFHRISLQSFASPSRPLHSMFASSLSPLAQTLPPVKTWVEFGERVSVFWSVYNIDRCWSVVGNPRIMSDDPAHGTQIDTPWPWDMHEYEMADMNADLPAFSHCDRTIQRFLCGEPPPEGVRDSSFASLRVKASAAHERVTKLTAAWKASQPGSSKRESIERDMRAFSVFLDKFRASLPPVENLEEHVTSSDARRTVYVVQNLANTSIICLHEVWAEERSGNQVESDICLEAAHQIARVPRAGVEVGLLDPVLGTTGMILASLFTREAIRGRKGPQTPESLKRLESIESGLEYLREIAILGNDRPLYGLQVPKILAILAKAEKRK